jgi:large subunit ribosomal protein L4
MPMVTRKSASAKATADKPAEKAVSYISAQDIDLTEDQRTRMREENYSQCVRALQQNWRQGTVACKGRSDVSFSNKKPWKQKGTGRARAGSARSPLWRKGGVTFGPQPRTRELTITKNMRRSVCNSLLWEYLDTKRIVAIDFASQDGAPKTAHASTALKNAGLQGKEILFFVSPTDRYTHASFANLPNVRMLLFDQWNVYDLSQGQLWMVLQRDMDSFKEMVKTWI